MTLSALIALLEESKEGSHVLDLEIWNAISDHVWRWHDEDQEWITCSKYGPGAVGNPVVSLDKFSRSLDAAITLVPPGFAWTITAQNVEGEMEYRAQIDYAKPSYAATAPLALVIAALKARRG
jgi:hypothetical protein